MKHQGEVAFLDVPQANFDEQHHPRFRALSEYDRSFGPIGESKVIYSQRQKIEPLSDKLVDKLVVNLANKNYTIKNGSAF